MKNIVYSLVTGAFLVSSAAFAEEITIPNTVTDTVQKVEQTVPSREYKRPGQVKKVGVTEEKVSPDVKTKKVLPAKEKRIGVTQETETTTQPAAE